MALKKPMHQGCGSAIPSSVFSKIGACLAGAVERPSLIALKRATIAVIAVSVLPPAVAMRPRSPSRSTNHSWGGMEHGPTTIAVK